MVFLSKLVGWAMSASTRHSYHLIEHSPWAITVAMGAGGSIVGGVMNLHLVIGCSNVFRWAVGLILYTLCCWWRDVVREAGEGLHSQGVQNGLRSGVLLFICSEFMFFLALFWAYFHSAWAPTVYVGCVWPPIGILHFDPGDLPFLNTLILLSSGGSITWSHHELLCGRLGRSCFALLATVALALVFSVLQGMEYAHSLVSLSDSIYGSTVFLSTGVHGVHVVIGTICSMICLIRQSRGGIVMSQQVGFETAAWYWHFVDVVWLCLFVSFYWWAGWLI